MSLVILALLIAVVPVYCVLAGLVELARHTDTRRSIADAFVAGTASLTASMRLRRQDALS